MLQNERCNIAVFSSDHSVPEDIHKNLFRVLCAILNLRVAQRGQPEIDQLLLTKYLSIIDAGRQEGDDGVIKQF